MTTTTGQRLIELEGGVFERAARSERDQAFRLEIPAARIYAGQKLAIVGPSGSGKTTLLGLLGLAIAPASAQRFQAWPDQMKPVDVLAAWRREDQAGLNALRGRFIGSARHSGESVAFLTPRQALAVRMRLAGAGSNSKAARELLADLDLAGVMNRPPEALSQGQRQRLGIACALIHRPALVLADEPTASLDAENADKVMNRLAAAAGDGRAVVIATHDPERALAHGFELVYAQMDADAGGKVKRTVIVLSSAPVEASAA